MKIQRSVIGRFLQLACKMWKSSYEGESRVVVFTFTERSCSVEMALDGLLLTYLFNRVDAEANERVIAVPFELLQDCSHGTGTVELCVVVKNGESCIAAKLSDGLVRRERMYPVQDLPEYYLLRDVAWHTIDERLVEQ